MAKHNRTHLSAHKYERFETQAGKVLYKCMLPACPHYLSTPQLVINRACLCWGDCGREFIVTRDYVTEKIKKPMCDRCREERAEARRSLANIKIEGEPDGM